MPEPKPKPVKPPKPVKAKAPPKPKAAAKPQKPPKPVKIESKPEKPESKPEKPKIEVLALPEHEDPMRFLIGVMTGPEIEDRLRIDAAKALMPYVYARKTADGGVGKKEQAQQEAETNHAGTGWSDLLPGAPLQ
jgi:phage terminase small subunit